MRTVYIKNYHYKGDLAEIDTDIEFMLSDSDFEKFNNGTSIDDLDERVITAQWITTLERRAAAEYFRVNYRRAFEGKFQPSSWDIQAIIGIFGITRAQAASTLGIDKGTLSNQINGKREMERSTAFLLLERLGLEMARPGAIKAMLDGSTESPKHSEKDAQMIENIRFHKEVA